MKISVAPPTSIKVEVDGVTAVVPIAIVLALQTEEARRFVANPTVGSFMYGASTRESRIRAATDLERRQTSAKRRAFVEAACLSGVTESEAWMLSKVKYP